MSERSYTLPAIRVTLEERDAIKREAESRGLSLSEWVRRASGAEGAQGSGAEPQPSPPEPPFTYPGEPLKVAPVKINRCPVKGCDYLAPSPVARCPRHARLVVPS